MKSRKNNINQNKTEPAEFLKRLAFFHDFNDYELKQMVAVGKWFRVPANEVIIKEGTSERAFYILVRGEATVCKQDANNETIHLTTLKSGSCFGEMAVLARTCRTADVIAKVESFLLRIEPEVLKESDVFLQLKFYRRFCETLVARLDMANKKMTCQVFDEDKALREVLATGVYSDSAAEENGIADRQVKASISWQENLTLPAKPEALNRLQASQVLHLIKPEKLKCINPAIIAELKHVFSSGGTRVKSRRFYELLTLDPVLCAKVLQKANSSAFGRPSPVLSIPHAIVIMGVNESEKLVRDITSLSKNQTIFSGVFTVASRFWRHGAIVGRIAELLRDTICLKTDVDIFMAGVLHDLGILALDTVCPEFYPQYARPSNPYPNQISSERHFIGIDHSKASLGLKTGMRLPQVYWDIMEGHHRLNEPIASPLATALIGIADLFAEERGAGLSGVKASRELVENSVGWQVLKDFHKPFGNTELPSFINSFRLELDKMWHEIDELVPLQF